MREMRQETQSFNVSILKAPPFPELKTERLLLRKATTNDVIAYHQILSCPEVSRYSDVPHNPTTKRSERFVSWMSKLHNRGKGVGWIITQHTNKSAIGSIRINSIEKKAQYGVIGYELHPDYWNTGIATEALASVVHHAHNAMSLNRLEAWTSTDNITSQKVLTKNGFIHEGTQRQKFWFRDQLWDVELFGRIASDKQWT